MNLTPDLKVPQFAALPSEQGFLILPDRPSRKLDPAVCHPNDKIHRLR